MHEGKMIHHPAFEIEAKDTNGAGDVFCGPIIHQLLEHASWPDALRFACATAALKTSRFGNREALPSKDQVERFLRSQE